MKLLLWCRPRRVLKYLCLAALSLLMVSLGLLSREVTKVKAVSSRPLISFRTGFNVNSLVATKKLLSEHGDSKTSLRHNQHHENKLAKLLLSITKDAPTKYKLGFEMRSENKPLVPHRRVSPSLRKTWSNEHDDNTHKDSFPPHTKESMIEYKRISKVRSPISNKPTANETRVSPSSQETWLNDSNANDRQLSRNSRDDLNKREVSSLLTHKDKHSLGATLDKNSKERPSIAQKAPKISAYKAKHHDRRNYAEYKELYVENGDVRRQQKMIEPVVVDGMYWSDAVESGIPKGVSEDEADHWLTTVQSVSVQSVQAASWNRCGGHQNAFISLRDGTSLCARYRTPRDRLVLGEVLSYWLSRLLRMDSVPPVALASSESLLSQKPRDFRNQGLAWRTGETVALIRWIDKMDSSPNTKVLMPRPILEAYKSNQPITAKDIEQSVAPRNSSRNPRVHSGNLQRNESRPTSAVAMHSNKTVSGLILEDLVVLAQWGTMIIFDYLTGTYDRVASMQDGAERENDPRILEESIRNLRPSNRGAKLWLIDNESGLLDAYTVLYLDNLMSDKFFAYHEGMLRTMCVFQLEMVRALHNLHKQKSPHRFLVRFAAKKDNLVNSIERDESFQLFKEHFGKRLDNVIKWIESCREKT